MQWLENARLFDELADKCGNRYLATLYVAKAARYLAQEHSVSMLESQLLTWALTGKPPNLSLARYKKIESLELSNIEFYLDYVEDAEVRDCVLQRYKDSVRNHHLVYQHPGQLDSFRTSRVNILLRMIWWDFLAN